MEEIKTKKIVSNIAWGYAEKGLSYLLQFIISIILARILDPAHFGTITLINIIINFLSLIMDIGLSTALIQKKDSDIYDFSTIFHANTIFGVLLYIILFFSAPLIAKFYNDQQIIQVVRVMGIWLIGLSVKNVYNAYITKNLQYKKFFWASFLGTVLSGVVSVYLAVNGYGIWSLVALHVIDNSVDAIILYITVEFKPLFYFSFERFKSLFKFGSRVFLTTLIDQAYGNIKSLAIGKIYSTETFAYYEKGKRYPSIIETFVSTVIGNIVFSLMSEIQDEKEKLKTYASYSLKMYTYILWPLMLGLAGVSNTFVLLFFTDKWIQSVPYIIIFCFFCGTLPITVTNLNIIKSLGLGNILLKKELIKKIIAILIMIIFIPFGPLWVAIGELIYCPIGYTINQLNGQKYVGYTIKEQYKDSLPHFIMALVMGIIVYLIGYINMPLVIKLLVQIVSGIAIYIFESIIFKSSMFRYLIIYFKHNILKK